MRHWIVTIVLMLAGAPPVGAQSVGQTESGSPPATPKPATSADVVATGSPASAAAKAGGAGSPQAPEADPTPVIEPLPGAVIEIVPHNPDHWDATVFDKPDAMSAMAGHVARGARIPVLGQVAVEGARYCQADLFYALSPFGFLCADDAQGSTDAPSTDTVLQPRADSSLPYDYAMVHVPEGEEVPMWASLSDVADYRPPKRMLGRGDTIAVEDKTISIGGERYRVSIDGDFVPAEQTYRMRKFSEWQGTPIDATTHLPFGWVTPRRARVYDAPRGKPIDKLERRARVDILGEETLGRRRWLKIGEGRYLRDRDVNEVRSITRPDGTGSQPQWLDVDLGEQVVVAYREAQPVFATLVSSGRPPHTTPRGNYPLWGKVSAITMQSQPYDDKPYYVHRVPWVLFFQAHNALHGAYWHDRFGVKKSHGCTNLSPKDARHLFEWAEPKLPPGWTAIRYTEDQEAPVVHVRHSGFRHPFKQERPTGPPDPEAEARRLEAAEERRARELQEQLRLEQAAAAAVGAQQWAPPMMPPAPLQTPARTSGQTSGQPAAPAPTTTQAQ